MTIFAFGRLGRRVVLMVGLVTLTGAFRPDLYEIPLEGVGPSSRMAGKAKLTPARSPFGLAMTEDGYFIFNIEVEAATLPPVAAFGPAYQTYVAWITSNDLSKVVRIGAFQAGESVKGKVAMNKYMVIVTAEASPDGEKWAGPIVLRGRSPSSYLSNFSSEEMFNGGVPR
jgi:hypothetical protein